MSFEAAMALVGKTYTAHSVPSNAFKSPWIISDLPEGIPTARILVYSHGEPEERCTIDSLSTTMLEKILEERKSEVTFCDNPLYVL
jgi:hypothetical protein